MHRGHVPSKMSMEEHPHPGHFNLTRPRHSASLSAWPLGPLFSPTEGLDTDKMSMEEFTMAKEARLKALGAEILTVRFSHLGPNGAGYETLGCSGVKKRESEVLRVMGWGRRHRSHRPGMCVHASWPAYQHPDPACPLVRAGELRASY